MIRVRRRGESPENMYRFGGMNDDRTSKVGLGERIGGQWDGRRLEETSKRPASQTIPLMRFKFS